MNRFEKHVVKMGKAFEGNQYLYKGKYFTFDKFRIVEMEGFVENEELKKIEDGSERSRLLEQVLYSELEGRDDMICSEYIDTKEFREIIKKIGGTRRDVSWSNGDIVLNARSLVDALDAMNAHWFFYNPSKSPKCGAIIFKDDEEDSICKEMILPQTGAYDKVGWYAHIKYKAVYKGFGGEG